MGILDLGKDRYMREIETLSQVRNRFGNIICGLSDGININFKEIYQTLLWSHSL